MTEVIVITVAGAPIGKGRPRFVRKTGHAFTPQKTRSYEAVLRDAAERVMGERVPIEGPLFVEVEALFPIPQSWSAKRKVAALAGIERPTVKPDADNLLKILDALNELVWKDDKQIVQATVRKRYSDKPALIVTVMGAA